MYFQNNNTSSTTSPQVFRNKNQVYRLQPGDVLSINVKSVETQFSDYLNKQDANDFNNFNEPGLYVNGYSIDDEGYIFMPNIGRILVAGKTISDVRTELQQIISTKITTPSVFVTLISFKISVMGEVNRPGYYFVYNDQATLLEGLSLGGDLLEFADRKNISLIRRTREGSMAVKIDLTDAKIMESRYFYLQPNDVIYVPPLELKNQRSNLANLNIVSTILAGVSTAVTLYLVFVDNNN